jgi:hypothetical protein
MVVGSDAPSENLQVEETAHAPLRGASPPCIESASEQEESPTANDCTSLTLVDVVPDESEELEEENQVTGEEEKDCQGGNCSAPSVVQNKKCSTLAIAKTLELVEQSQPASLRDAQGTLTVENSVSGGVLQADHGSTSSAPQADKWSSEAIAVRSKARPWRMEKLKMAGILREKPDFDFLLECWQDDPALEIVIKKLLAKFPQWGIACVDGMLVKWDE